MKMLKYTPLLLLASLFLIFITSCTYDNEEDLYPEPEACDTTVVTYGQTVQPLISAKCIGCHIQQNAQGNVRLDNYDEVKKHVDNGSLWGAVNHEDGFSPMPKGQAKMDECDLHKIRIWIDAGAPNN